MRIVPEYKWRITAATSCVVVLFLLWIIATRGPAEERMVSPTVLGSPEEMAESFKSLWFDRALSRNLITSLWRVVKGFGLAAMIGIPLGIICGAWPLFNSFLSPVTVFGRNVPMSALVPLTLLWFGIDEGQKIMFIFVACIAFIIFDSTRAITDVHEKYVQTAKTLGASDAQVLYKVLVPLAMPDIFGSLRLLFGLAFGYIVLAEMVNMNGGVGELILTSQRQGPREHVYLVLVMISIVAFGIDKGLLAIERRVFRYRSAQ